MRAKVLQILKSIPLDSSLLKKRFCDWNVFDSTLAGRVSA